MEVMAQHNTDTIAQLKDLYKQYREAPDIESKAQFFSSHCRQICATYPKYAAKDRDTIVCYLQESAKAESGIPVIDDAVKNMNENTKAFCTIKALHEDEVEFGTDEQARCAGFEDSNDLRRKAEDEGWKGLRVDLWTDSKDALLVKVKYWWRLEGEQWLQILHHIIYLGPLDDTEGKEGEIQQ